METQAIKIMTPLQPRTVIAGYLRCYIIWSKLWCHQVTLVYFGKSKVTQFNRSILKQGEEASLQNLIVSAFLMHISHLTFATCSPLLYLYPHHSTEQLKDHKLIFETIIFVSLVALSLKQFPSDLESTLHGCHCICRVVTSRRMKRARAWICQSTYTVC